MYQTGCPSHRACRKRGAHGCATLFIGTALSMSSKACAGCGEVYELTDGFHLNASSPDGHRSRCKGCCSDYGKRWHTINAPRVKEKQRRTYAANRGPEQVETNRK